MVRQHESDHAGLLAAFVRVVVPEMNYVGERQQLYRHATDRVATDGADAIRTYCDVNDATSIGLDGLDPFGAQPTEADRDRYDHTGKVL